RRVLGRGGDDADRVGRRHCALRAYGQRKKEHGNNDSDPEQAHRAAATGAGHEELGWTLRDFGTLHGTGSGGACSTATCIVWRNSLPNVFPRSSPYFRRSMASKCGHLYCSENNSCSTTSTSGQTDRSRSFILRSLRVWQRTTPPPCAGTTAPRQSG